LKTIQPELSPPAILKLVGVFILLLVTAACTPVNGSALPTLKIGLVAPFEGRHRPLGYEVLFAVKLALQERNAGAGLSGYRVELVALNDFDEPDEAKIQAQALTVDPDVMGVVGHLSATTTEAAWPVYDAAGLAVVSPWSVSPASPSPSGTVSVAADLAETADHLNRFMDSQGFHEPQIISSLDIPPLQEQTPALILASDGLTAGEIILQLEDRGSTLPRFGRIEVGSPQLTQVAEDAADGLIFVSPGPSLTDTVGGEDFATAYQALAGFSPGPRAILAYDATHTLLDAIEQAIQTYDRQPTRVEVSQRIRQIERPGLTGQITFNQQGRRIEAPIWLYEIADGQYPGIPVSP